MKKELAATAADFGTKAVFWSLLVGELAVSVVFALSDRLPPVLVRSLQLFLRF